MYARAPIVHGDRILVYYYGTNSRSPEQAFDLGEKATTAIGLATLPLDGFVSLDGAKGPVDYRPAPTDIEPHSRMVTRSFGFSGERLYLNLQAPPRFNSAGPCEVRVEILTANHERIPGFSAADADALTTTGSAHVVSWNGNSQVGRFSGSSDPAAVLLQERQALLVPVPVADCLRTLATSMPPTTTHERISRRSIA